MAHIILRIEYLEIFWYCTKRQVILCWHNLLGEWLFDSSIGNNISPLTACILNGEIDQTNPVFQFILILRIEMVVPTQKRFIDLLC